MKDIHLEDSALIWEIIKLNLFQLFRINFIFEYLILLYNNIEFLLQQNCLQVKKYSLKNNCTLSKEFY